MLGPRFLFVSQGAAVAGEAGWIFGVTGKRSHMPQTLVLKLLAPTAGDWRTATPLVPPLKSVVTVSPIELTLPPEASP